MGAPTQRDPMTAEQPSGTGPRPPVVVVGAIGRLADLVVADLASDREVVLVGSAEDVAALTALLQPSATEPVVTEPAASGLVGRTRATATSTSLASAVEVLILGGTGRRDVDGSGIGLVDTDLVQAAIDGLAARSVASIVVLSSALIYDNCRDQPLPIDESAVPAGGASVLTKPSEPALASRLAAERVVVDATHPRLGGHTDEFVSPIRLVVLRTAICGGTAARPWFSRSLFARRRVVAQHAAPLQMVHLDDVVAAVRHAFDSTIAGTFHVAADGWMNEQTLTHLADRTVRVAAPSWLLRAINSTGWYLGRASTPSTMLSHVVTPSMVSSSALRSTGWKPVHSNEEAFLTSSYPSWWGSLTARRRQDVSLGLFVSAIIASIAGLGTMIRRAGTTVLTPDDE